MKFLATKSWKMNNITMKFLYYFCAFTKIKFYRNFIIFLIYFTGLLIFFHFTTKPFFKMHGHICFNEIIYDINFYLLLVFAILISFW